MSKQSIWALGPHEANLFDMQQKYADVMDSAAVMHRLVGLPGKGA